MTGACWRACSALDSLVQVAQPALETRLVVLPPQAIHTRRGVALEFVERLPEQIDPDVMQERNEPFLLSSPCHLPYAVQRL
jgi:hypothetical protein